MIKAFEVHEAAEDPEHTLAAASFILRELYEEPDPDELFVDLQLDSLQSGTIVTAHALHGPIIAAAALKTGPLDDEARIVDVATSKDMRGYGVGRAIMVHLEELAGDRGVQMLSLQPLPQVLGFYEKLGYSPSSSDPRLYIKHI